MMFRAALMLHINILSLLYFALLGNKEDNVLLEIRIKVDTNLRIPEFHIELLNQVWSIYDLCIGKRFPGVIKKSRFDLYSI